MTTMSARLAEALFHLAQEARDLQARLAPLAPEEIVRVQPLVQEWIAAMALHADRTLVAEGASSVAVPLDVHKDCADYLREDPGYVCGPDCPARWRAALGRLVDEEDEEDVEDEEDEEDEEEGWVREGWSMPDPPAEGLEAVALIGGMHVGTYWVPEGMDDPAWCVGNYGEIPWPLEDHVWPVADNERTVADYVRVVDVMKGLGFRVLQ